MNTTTPSTLARALTGLVTLVVLSLLSACASYHLGSSAPLQFKSIYIRPTTNHSFAPQAQPVVSAQLREAFIKDGRVKLVANEKDADVVLSVDLTDYNRTAGARNSKDTEVANSFEVQLEAEISLFNTRDDSYYFQERTVISTTNTYIGNPYTEGEIISYQQSEYLAMPQLAREIARKIADEVLSPW